MNIYNFWSGLLWGCLLMMMMLHSCFWCVGVFFLLFLLGDIIFLVSIVGVRGDSIQLRKKKNAAFFFMAVFLSLGTIFYLIYTNKFASDFCSV